MWWSGDTRYGDGSKGGRKEGRKKKVCEWRSVLARVRAFCGPSLLYFLLVFPLFG